MQIWTFKIKVVFQMDKYTVLKQLSTHGVETLQLKHTKNQIKSILKT